MVQAQEGSSMYFREAQPKGEAALEKIPESFLGHYRSTHDSLKSIIITTDSIYVELVTIGILSEKEVRDNPKLELKDTLLYGIYSDKPVEVIVKNDTLIFAVVSRHLFCKFSEQTTIKSLGDHLLISTETGEERFLVCCISLEKEGIQVAYVDHELEMELIKKQKGFVQKKEAAGDLYLLDLNALEMKKFIEKKGFNDGENLTRY